MFYYLRFFIIINIFSIMMGSLYNVGDQVNEMHQNMQFDVCYGAECSK